MCWTWTMSASQRDTAAEALEGVEEEVKACLLAEGTPLEAPIKKVAEKWKLLPAFLKVW